MLDETNIKTRLTLLHTLLFSFSTIFAQETVIINDVRLFNGNTVKENVYVVLENGIIDTISSKPISRQDVTNIDGTDKTLIPGLTNAHVHAWSAESLNEAAKAGVLNVLDMHGVEFMMLMMKQYNKSNNHANFYASGAAATAPEGHGTQFGFSTPILSKPEEAKQFVTNRVNAGADYIKIIVEPWKKTLDHKTIKALIDEAHKQGKVTVVHVSNLDDGFKAFNSNAGGLAHIWWDTQIPEAQLKQLSKQKSQFVIPTLLTSIIATNSIRKNTSDEKFLSEIELKLEVKKLYDAGVVILAGTDPPNYDINYGTDLYKELRLLSESGIPNIDVLKGATSATSKVFDLKDKGIIETGVLANMILINGNPLITISEIANIETIWKNGKEVNR